jgi:hypothetical protein
MNEIHEDQLRNTLAMLREERRKLDEPRERLNRAIEAISTIINYDV